MRHTVETGETPQTIASRYGTTVVALERANDGDDPTSPFVEGGQIEVPLPYVTREGDTMTAVATRFGVDLARLRSVNPPPHDEDEEEDEEAEDEEEEGQADEHPDADHPDAAEDALPEGRVLQIPGVDETSMMIEEVTHQEFLASHAGQEGVDYEELARRCLSEDRSSVAHAAQRLQAVRSERASPQNGWDNAADTSFVIGAVSMLVVVGVLLVGAVQWLISKLIDGFVGQPWIDIVGTVAFAAIFVFFGLGALFERLSARADVKFLRRSRWAARRRDFNDAVRNFIVQPAIQDLMLVHFDPAAAMDFDASALTTTASVNQIVRTDTYREMARHLSRADGATLGLRGARGSGKTDLLRAFCRVASTTGLDDTDDDDTPARGEPSDLEEERVVGVFIAAPTSTEEFPFLRRVALLVCDRTLQQEEARGSEMATRRKSAWTQHVVGPLIVLAGVVIALRLHDRLEAPHIGIAIAVIGFVVTISIEIGHRVRIRRQRSGPRRRWGRRDKQRDASRQLHHAAAEKAQRLQRQLRFAKTTEDHAEGSAKLQALSAKVSRSVSLAEYPLTKDDIVEDLSSVIRLLDDAGVRVIIGIDEFDRLEVEEEKTTKLLNTMKALFAIPACSFIVTISDSAWATFEQRGLKVRTVFDSSFDDIIEVRPLSFRAARSILRSRGAMLSDTQVLLVNTMAGGAARDLIRQARALARSSDRAQPGGDQGELIRHYLDEDARSKITAAIFDLRSDAPTTATEEAIDTLDEIRHELDGYDLDRLLDKLRELCGRDAHASNGHGPGSGTSDAQVDRILSRTISYLAFVKLVWRAFDPDGPIQRLARTEPVPFEQLPDDAFEPYEALIDTYQWLGSSCRSALSRLERAAEIVEKGSMLPR